MINTSTHPEKTEFTTFMSQILMKICSQTKFQLKMQIFLFLRKSDKRVKSYDPVKFWVDPMIRVVQTAVSQKLPPRDFILVSFFHKLKGLS